MNPAFNFRVIPHIEWVGNRYLPNSDKCITVFKNSGVVWWIYLGKKVILAFYYYDDDTIYIHQHHNNELNLAFSVVCTLLPQINGIRSDSSERGILSEHWNNRRINLTGYYLNEFIYTY